MHFLKALGFRLAAVFAAWGGLGLFTVNFLDSSFLSFPVINDLLLIHLAAQHPARAAIYAVLATVGSVAGSFCIFGVALAGEEFFLHKLTRKRGGTPKEHGRVYRWMERNEFVAILVASLLPPPTPFKIFPFVAGALKMHWARFAASLALGRFIRFGAEAYLGSRYGAAAEVYLRKNMLKVSLIAVAVIVILTALSRLAGGRTQAKPCGS